MNCRICMEAIYLAEACGNICLCKEVYFHERCAVKWFTPRIQGLSGKAISNSWDTKWHATCEVCQSKIDDYIVKKCITNLKRECFSKLQKSMNPLPNVPQTASHPPLDLQSPQQPLPRQIQRSRFVPVSSPWSFFGCFTGE